MFQNIQIDDNLPDIEEITFLPIQKNYLKLMLVKTTIIFSIIITCIIFITFPQIPVEYSDYNYLIILGVITVYVIVLLIIFLAFKKKKYAIRQKDITFSRGILIHTLTTIPFSRIQHIEIDEGAFERPFKLASITIYTAGDNGKDLKINGLNRNKAIQMKELITNYLKDESE